MKMRNLLTMFAIVLLMSVAATAQRTPPTPATPPAPPSGIVAPVPPVFSFSFEGGSYLGVSPENISRENMSQYGLSAPRGVGVRTVSPDGPADKAGLKKGDVILQFDGEPVTSTMKLFRLIGESAPEQSVRLTISRNGSEQQLNVTLGKRETPARAFGVTPPDLDYFRMSPNAPRALGRTPEVFGYGFGNNRRIGITTATLTKQLADYFGVSGGHGLLISSISDNSPASKAGLKAGDVITEVNGEKVEDADDFIRALNYKEEGEVTLTIIREKSQRTIKVTPERRPVPSINLSELQAMPMTSNMLPLGRPMDLMEMPDVRTLQVMPKIETFALPKWDRLTVTPRLMTLPRVELLQTIPPML
jgi:serine protease Do